MRDGRVIGTHALRRFRLNPNRIAIKVKQLGDALANRRRMRPNLRLGQDKRRIHVRDRVARPIDSVQSLVKEYNRVGALPLGISGGEERSDIRRSDRPQQGIGDRV